MCCYFDYIIKIEDFDFGNILLDEKSYENILIYAVLHKTLICPKPLHIMFDKVDGFTRDYDGTKHFVLFNLEKHVIYGRIRYLICLTSGFIFTFSHIYAEIKIDSDDGLPLEETLIFYVILIKSIFI